MDTSTSSTSSPLEDSLWVSSIKVPPVFEVSSTPAWSRLMTTVQISPVRAPPDITRAIRRQKQAAGVAYSRPPEPPKQEFKIVLSGSTRFIVTSSHCLSSESGTWGSSSYHQLYSQGADVGGNHRTCRRSRSFNGGSFHPLTVGTDSQERPVTWSRGSDEYNRQKVEAAHTDNTWGRYQNLRYHKSLHVLGRSAKVADATGSSFQGEILPDVLNTGIRSSFGGIETARQRDHFDSQAVPVLGAPYLAATDNRSTLGASVEARSSSLQTTASSVTHRSQKTGETSSLQPAEAMLGLQFADAILDSVGWNLDRLYKLCQRKFRYYEYFERFQECPTSSAQTQSFNDFPASDSAPHFMLPKMPSVLSQSSSSLSPNLSSSNGPVDPFTSRRSESNCPQDDVLPDYKPYHQQVRAPVSSGQLRHLVIESNPDRQSVRTSRSILKAPRIYRERGRLFTDNFASMVVSESRTTTEGPLVPHKPASGEDLLTDYSITRVPGSRPTAVSKGRLVRFSADDQIHEFTSLEPVASGVVNCSTSVVQSNCSTSVVQSNCSTSVVQSKVEINR